MSSLSERFQQAQRTPDPLGKIQALQALEGQVPRPSSNESLEDVATSTLSFLALDHLLAEAHTNLSGLDERLDHLQRAIDYWCRFLEALDRLDLLDKAEREQFEQLQQQGDDDTAGEVMATVMPNRELKIARFRALQGAQNEKARLESLQARRGRLQIAETEALDGHDAESLERATSLIVLKVYKAQALEGWGDVLREIPLLKRRMQQQEQINDPRYRTSQASAEPPRPPSSGLQVTRVTQDATTGQLHMKREEIRSNVLRAGWNQPTMSLEELAQREVAAARQREADQKVSEAERAKAPRRYDQLVKDGQEDDADLVDASAALDRDWDNFKDANPRGSGNKRGDVGDRNF